MILSLTICVHQFTGLAAEIAAGGMFDVFALDSLGFGFSEKPPISYNQYLWRDQVRRVAHHQSTTTTVSLVRSVG